jgi:hypothetical protein
MKKIEGYRAAYSHRVTSSDIGMNRQLPTNDFQTMNDEISMACDESHVGML